MCLDEGNAFRQTGDYAVVEIKTILTPSNFRRPTMKTRWQTGLGGVLLALMASGSLAAEEGGLQGRPPWMQPQVVKASVAIKMTADQPMATVIWYGSIEPCSLRRLACYVQLRTQLCPKITIGQLGQFLQALPVDPLGVEMQLSPPFRRFLGKLVAPRGFGYSRDRRR